MGEKRPKNILHEVLYGVDDDPVHDAPLALDKLDRLIHRPFNATQPVKHTGESGGDAQRLQHILRQPELKKRTTIYLSQTTYEQLAASKPIIREMLPKGAAVRVSMSGIAEKALRIMLNELKLKRKDSLLLKLMLDEFKKS